MTADDRRPNQTPEGRDREKGEREREERNRETTIVYFLCGMHNVYTTEFTAIFIKLGYYYRIYFNRHDCTIFTPLLEAHAHCHYRTAYITILLMNFYVRPAYFGSKETTEHRLIDIVKSWIHQKVSETF